MIQLPDDLSDRDARQWIGRGWFLVRHKAELVPAYVEGEILAEERRAACHLMLPEGGRVSWVSFDNIVLHWPKFGYVNVASDKSAVRAERLQRRQYTRCLNANCFSTEFVGSGVRGQIRTDLNNIVYNMYRPLLYSPQDAVDMVLGLGGDEPWASCAVSNALCFVRTRPGEAHVEYEGVYVGEWNGYAMNPVCDDLTAQRVAKMLERATSRGTTQL